VPAGKEAIEMNLSGIMRDLVLQNQVVFGTVNASRSTFEAAIRQLEQFMGLFPHAVRGLITERVALDEAPNALRRHAGIKQVIQVAS
jgi:hypothetical protein